MSQLSNIVKELLDWYGRQARDLPWRRVTAPYGVWVAEIMLQQTGVKTVVPYWERWMRELPTIALVARAEPDRLLKLWEGLGYYHRVRRLQEAAQAIQRRHEGEFPEKFEDILNLPGVGRYTAGAVASIAFGQARPVLDGNVVRVLSRLYEVTGSVGRASVRRRLWEYARKLVEQAAGTSAVTSNPCGDLNQALIELGASVCRPRSPGCERCPVSRFCRAKDKGSILELPDLGKKAAIVACREIVLVVSRGEDYLVRQRRAGQINGLLWEFPNCRTDESDPEGWAWLQRNWGLNPKTLEFVGEIKHAITVNRISLLVYRCRLEQDISLPDDSCRWVARSELKRLAFTGANRKILRRLDDE